MHHHSTKFASFRFCRTEPQPILLRTTQRVPRIRLSSLGLGTEYLRLAGNGVAGRVSPAKVSWGLSVAPPALVGSTWCRSPRWSDRRTPWCRRSSCLLPICCRRGAKAVVFSRFSSRGYCVPIFRTRRVRSYITAAELRISAGSIPELTARLRPGSERLIHLLYFHKPPLPLNLRLSGENC